MTSTQSYSKQIITRYGRYAWPPLLLSALLVVAIFLSLGIGAVIITPAQVWAALTSPASAGEATRTIVMDFRLARLLLVALTGAGLGGAGAAFQGLFRNPLADPFVIGASGGAALGATLAITLGWTATWLGFGPVPLAAFGGALLAVGLAYGISVTSGQVATLALLLAGTALSSLFSACVSLLMVFAGHDFANVFFWLLGGFSGRSWDDLWLTLPYILTGLIGLGLLARPPRSPGFWGRNRPGTGSPRSAGSFCDCTLCGPGYGGGRSHQRHYRICGADRSPHCPSIVGTRPRPAAAHQRIIGGAAAGSGRHGRPHRSGPGGATGWGSDRHARRALFSVPAENTARNVLKVAVNQR